MRVLAQYQTTAAMFFFLKTPLLFFSSYSMVLRVLRPASGVQRRLCGASYVHWPCHETLNKIEFSNCQIFTIIQCSAGVGRTGTYVAIDVLLDQARYEGEIDLYSITQKMRKNRVNMIQTVVSS